MIVITNHAIKRYRQRIGHKRASKGKIDRLIRKGIAVARRKIFPNGTVIFRAPNFDAVCVREGINLVVATIQEPRKDRASAEGLKGIGSGLRMCWMQQEREHSVQSLCKRLEIQAHQAAQEA